VHGDALPYQQEHGGVVEIKEDLTAEDKVGGGRKKKGKCGS